MSNAILQCPICTSAMQVTLEMAGTQSLCPSCRNPVQLPPDLTPFLQAPADSPIAADEIVTAAVVESDSTITATCSGCHKAFGLTASMAGQQVACPFCHQVTQLPRPGNPTPTEPVFDTIAVDEEAIDESELFAPGFAPETEPAQSIEHAARAEEKPSDIEASTDGVVAEAVAREDEKLPEFATVIEDDSEDASNSSESNLLSEVDHPLLPPRFISRSLAGLQSAPNPDENTIYLPAPAGGVQAIDKNLVGIKTKMGRVVVRSVPKEKKEIRRTVRSLIVYLFCLIVLVLVLFLLMRATH